LRQLAAAAELIAIAYAETNNLPLSLAAARAGLAYSPWPSAGL
jgi:hypothetical protein